MFSDIQPVYTKLSSKLKEFLNVFGETPKVNSNCDGDRDSYDAMVLLTGRYDYEEMGGGDPESTSFCLQSFCQNGFLATLYCPHLVETDLFGQNQMQGYIDLFDILIQHRLWATAFPGWFAPGKDCPHSANLPAKPSGSS